MRSALEPPEVAAVSRGIVPLPRFVDTRWKKVFTSRACHAFQSPSFVMRARRARACKSCEMSVLMLAESDVLRGFVRALLIDRRASRMALRTAHVSQSQRKLPARRYPCTTLASLAPSAHIAACAREPLNG